MSVEPTSTLLRVLSVCAASSRKSLQGVNYISSSGAQAFGNLAEVAENRGDREKGMHWVKDVQNRLHAAKRYVKSDYRVSFLIDHLDRTMEKPLQTEMLTRAVVYINFIHCFKSLSYIHPKF